MYIYEDELWPNFTWDQSKIFSILAEVRYLQGGLLGKMSSLGFELQQEASFNVLTQDVMKTSEIEGEKLDLEQVRSSLANRLGIDIGATSYSNRNVEGVVDIMLDATTNYHIKLTKERLFGWHAALFQSGRSGLQRVTVGAWRDHLSGAMQVVSGPHGREKVYYEAPGYERVAAEMDRFIVWLNSDLAIDLVIKSAVAHFWFLTIHPFDDGNGRIARALADMILAQSEQSSQRFYSVSSQILRERQGYYNILEKCQKGTVDITAWIEWFLECLKNAITNSEEMLQNVLVKANFWQKYAGCFFNDRQRNIMNLLLRGFEGKLTSSKWAKITKCSQDTALRDITDLLEKGVLVKDVAGGRSSNYALDI